jgi:hypothetical protein
MRTRQTWPGAHVSLTKELQLIEPNMHFTQTNAFAGPAKLVIIINLKSSS